MPAAKTSKRPKYKRKKKKLSWRSKPEKKWTLVDWKEWLWDTRFSPYIRLRDCLRTTGSPDCGQCVTCHKVYPRNRLQAGHFVPGRTDAILFDEDCVHAQCYRCNCVLDAWPEYYRFMQKEYGQEKIEQLIDQRDEKVELTVDWIKEAHEYYTKRIEEFLNGNNVFPDEGVG